jgi:hypothetical protein
MTRNFLKCLLGAVLLASAPAVDTALAGKGGSSGGRSFSSGGRSFSSGSRGFSSGSRGFSSGSRAFGSSNRPVHSSGGKSYSSGTPRPASSTPGKTYSPGKPAAGTPRGKGYGSGSPGRSVASPSRPVPSPVGRPVTPFDRAAGEAQRKAESRAAFTRGRQPEKTWVDSADSSHPIDPQSKQIENLRRELNYQRWVNRTYREQQVFGPYYSQPVVVYHDPYSSFFWWWLLDRNLEQQALWTYHHRADMDDARYQALLSHNAALEARVKQLESSNTPRDPTYAPAGLDPDLMYTDQYVRAVYNPQRVPFSLWHWLRFLLYALLILAALAFLIWLIFIKRWGAVGPAPAAGS